MYSVLFSSKVWKFRSTQAVIREPAICSCALNFEERCTKNLVLFLSYVGVIEVV